MEGVQLAAVAGVVPWKKDNEVDQHTATRATIIECISGWHELSVVATCCCVHVQVHNHILEAFTHNSDKITQRVDGGALNDASKSNI